MAKILSNNLINHLNSCNRMDIEFNSDGSIKVPESLKGRLSKPVKELPDHIKVLKLIDEMSFPVGRKLLAEILIGEKNPRIKKLQLNQLLNYGSLDLYDYKDIYRLIEKMQTQGLIEITKTRTSGFLPVIQATRKGQEEMVRPIEDGDSCEYEMDIDEDPVTDEDRKKFEALGDFLDIYNEEQKKAIIENCKKILCIAGAGSGKTTVLTKRIEFLVKYKNIPSDEILAITFTRKARLEMIARLNSLIPGHKVNIETFNSFCEKILKKHGNELYEKEYRMIDYSEKIKIVRKVLADKGYTMLEAMESYFSKKKIREEDNKKLFFNFINDIFGIIDHYKNNELPLSRLRQAITSITDMKEKNQALFVCSLVDGVEKIKEEQGYRDFTDQIVHALKLFRTKENFIPNFSHILVDEYQDVNEIQVQLIKTLNGDNLFAVGDPRQSIYGWRGSKVEYIMNFKKDNEECKVIQLKKNYRSTKNIVDLGNHIVRGMCLPNIDSVKEENKPIALIQHDNEQCESLFVAQSILSQQVRRKDIFILARTNKQLDRISEVLGEHSIRFLKRTLEEQKQDVEPSDEEITLSTVHAIKGLEAEVVYLIGTNTNMYPCMTKDHPVIEAVKINENYDKYNEEIRLLYVALTRAKSQLIVNYSANLTNFINETAKKMMQDINNAGISSKPETVEEKLREWRKRKASELGYKPYMIFNDKTLFELIQNSPTSYDELAMISGIGPAKVDQLGDEILDIINGIQ